MNKIRKVIAYGSYFEDFLKSQPIKIQDKIFKVIEIIETYERIPNQYLRSIIGAKGLYEARVKLSTNIWRVFCFFDEGRLVILLNGFQKKTQKTPRKEIELAVNLMNEYFEEKRKGN
ncbi:type II toxin-antitoxin system RelE/ParE family toxin [Puteibacter caeruleilacunae]|nr:type II toxin-antitoxin system RelE/ParE family toxin [Puteibacter caeruleilacunae]